MSSKSQQEMYLKQLAEAKKQEALAKIAMRSEIEARYREELAALRYGMSRIANTAKAAGVSATRIGRAIGTTNWDTIRTLLALAASEFGETADTAEPWLVKRGEDGRLQSVTFLSWRTKAGDESSEPLEVPLRFTPYGYRTSTSLTPAADPVWLIAAVAEIDEHYNDKGEVA